MCNTSPKVIQACMMWINTSRFIKTSRSTNKWIIKRVTHRQLPRHVANAQKRKMTDSWSSDVLLFPPIPLHLTFLHTFSHRSQCCKPVVRQYWPDALLPHRIKHETVARHVGQRRFGRPARRVLASFAHRLLNGGKAGRFNFCKNPAVEFVVGFHVDKYVFSLFAVLKAGCGSLVDACPGLSNEEMEKWRNGEIEKWRTHAKIKQK